MSAKKMSAAAVAKAAAIAALPANVADMRTRMNVNNNNIQNTHSLSSADAFGSWGIDQSYSAAEFDEGFEIDIIEINEAENSLVFDMIGVEAPIANALRRILLSEVPTMAIETILLFQNTSIIQDEVLSHRLGLIPIMADPRRFEYVKDSSTTPQVNEHNTLVFTLEIKCTRNSDASDSAPDCDKYINSLVHSSELQWVPQGRQAELFSGEKRVRMMYDDIVIAKLRPGQSIEAELRCEKGIGRDHAKWSPVATASYRLMPEIVIHEAIMNEDADTLVRKCPMNVFDIEDVGNSSNDRRATVARPRNCSMCRECIREEGWMQRLELRRIRNHFIFSIETVGHYTPQDVLREAITVLKNKATTLKTALTQAKQAGSSSDSNDSSNSNNNERGMIAEQDDESEDENNSNSLVDIDDTAVDSAAEDEDA